jgi:hypothetical protein
VALGPYDLHMYTTVLYYTLRCLSMFIFNYLSIANKVLLYLCKMSPVCYSLTVLEMNYLYSVLLSANGSFVQTQRTLAEQAKRAVFALKSILSKKSCDVRTKLYLFDTMITPILTYGAEVWGFHAALDIEKIHISFCKSVLGVNSKTSNVAVLGELGRMPMNILRQKRILKY